MLTVALDRLLQAKRLGDGGTGDIGVKDRDLVALALHIDRQHGGDQRLTDTALTADNTDNVLYARMFVQLFEEILGIVLFGTGTTTAVSRAVCFITFSLILNTISETVF